MTALPAQKITPPVSPTSPAVDVQNNTPAPARAPPPAPRRSRPIALIIAAIAAAGAVLVLYAWQLPPFSRGVQVTENAYVRGQVTVISPQVAGAVSEVEVQDFQSVRKGDLLVTLDDRIYRQRLDQATATLHAAQAQLANSPQAVAAATNSVAQYQASIESASALLAKASADATRTKSLYDAGAASRADLDASRAALASAESQLEQAKAQRGTAGASVTSANINRGALEAAVEAAQAQVRLAEIDLENSRIYAPRDGRLGEVTVRQGAQVSVGTQLMALVPDRIWVVANLKETQMENVAVGQSVTVAVDALGGQEVHGKVEVIAPATGAEFSVIKPDNATGNFTKVPQRVPVRIQLDEGQPLVHQLRPGMSVVARIDTRQ